MKLPLEPIPTEQTVNMENVSPHDGLKLHEDGYSMNNHRRDSKGDNAAAKIEKAYPWLLGASTCLSALLCWMYVTKPVIASSDTQRDLDAVELAAASVLPDKGSVLPDKKNFSTADDLIPSDNALPGSEASDTRSASQSDSQRDGVMTGNAELMSSQHSAAASLGERGPAEAVEWEATNLKVQHVLKADAGDGQMEKIVINVPVFYQTRTMRWSAENVDRARTVLSRLMIYEQNLNKLRKDGQALLKDWNDLLEETVPAPALRADSPSLPYNHSQREQLGGLPSSSSAIKVEH